MGSLSPPATPGAAFPPPSAPPASLMVLPAAKRTSETSATMRALAWFFVILFVLIAIVLIIYIIVVNNHPNRDDAKFRTFSFFSLIHDAADLLPQTLVCLNFVSRENLYTRIGCASGCGNSRGSACRGRNKNASVERFPCFGFTAQRKFKWVDRIVRLSFVGRSDIVDKYAGATVSAFGKWSAEWIFDAHCQP